MFRLIIPLLRDDEIIGGITGGINNININLNKIKKELAVIKMDIGK